MLIEIQVLPNPAGDGVEPYRHVEAAIAVIAESGLNYEVGALGTVVEGEPDRIWPVLRAVHEATLTSGAQSVVTAIKVHQSAAGGATIAGLTAKFRS